MSHQREHWKRIYTEKAPDAVSWFEAVPRASLAMIDELALPLDAPIADVGGGASHLAAELVASRSFAVRWTQAYTWRGSSNRWPVVREPSSRHR